MKRITFLITFIILILHSISSIAQVTIGDEEITGKKIPINPFYGYTYSQVIYLQSELGDAMDIGHLIYTATPETTLEESSLWTVYIGHTPKTQFETTTDWVALADLTEVFAGTVTIADGTVHILLDSEFSYNGTDNLVIAVDENQSGYDGFSHSFYASTVTDNRSLSFWNDTTNPSPEAPPVAMLHQNFIANITIAPTPTCSWPTDLVASGMTGTTADLGWTENGTATSWQIEYGEEGFTAGEGTIVTADANPFTITELSSGTNYDFYVQAVCGVDDMSTWTGPYTFQTIITCPVPTSLLADSITTDSANLTWVETGTATSWNLEYGETGFTLGEGTMETAVTNPYALIGLSSETTYDFYVQADCSDEDMSTMAGPYTFTTLISCPAPTDLLADGMTEDSATLSWVEAGSATMWNLEYGLTGFISGEGTLVNDVTSPYTLTGLTDSTVYDFYVQAACDTDDLSSWSGPFTFSTSIVAGTCGLYSIELTDTYGDGWNGGVVDVYINGTLFYDDLTIVTGTGPEVTEIPVDIGDVLSFIYTSGSWASENEYRIYNQLGNLIAEEGIDPSIPENIGDPTIPSGIEACPSCPAPTGLTTNLILAYTAELAWEENGDATMWNIEYGPTGFAVGEGTAVAADANPYTISGLTAETTYDYYVQANCGDDDMSVWVGPYTFTTPVTCPAPTELTASGMTETTADLGWMENGEATMWNIEYGPVGFVLGEGTIVPADANPFTLTGLTDSTSYDYYVQANCGDEDGMSSWVGPFNFNTTLVAGTCGIYTIELIDTFGDGWNGGFVDVYINGALYAGGLTIATGSGPETTGISVDIEDVLSFIYTPGSWSSENEYRIYDQLGTLVAEEGVGSVPENIGDPTIPTGIQTCPSCPSPLDLAVTPDTYEVDFTWVEYGTATMWNIEYGPAGFTLGSGTMILGVTTTSHTITGLDPVTSYDVYVQADCGDGDVSMWVGPISFTTLHIPIVNDDCDTAIELISGDILDTTLFDSSASGEMPLPDDACGDTGAGMDVWYSFTATELSDVTISTGYYGDSSLTDTILAVYSGECGALELIDCNDDFESAFSAVTAYGIEAGETIYIRVFSWGGLAFDTFTIEASFVPGIGIDESLISDFNMFPNPVDDTLNIKASVTLDTITIFDMLGREVITTTPLSMETTLDTSALQTGAYIVKVQSGTNIDSFNLIKQ